MKNRNYNKFGRTYLFDIDFHHLKDDDSNWNNKFTVDAYHAGNVRNFINSAINYSELIITFSSLAF